MPGTEPLLLSGSARNWRLAAEALKDGAVVVFPTDTVYGIGCDAFNVEAIRSIYELKGRPANKALPLLLSGADNLARAAHKISQEASLLAEALWPGALTLVVHRGINLPEELTGGDTVAVRVPQGRELSAFLTACGGFVAATSANISGQPDAVTAQEAYAYFRGGPVLIIDGGRAPGGKPSTVVDCTGETPRVLREGLISKGTIEEVLWRARSG